MQKRFTEWKPMNCRIESMEFFKVFFKIKTTLCLIKILADHEQ